MIKLIQQINEKILASFNRFFLVILINTIASPWAYSQGNGSPENNGNKIDGFPVTLADETLFVIQANVNSFSSEERAETINNRLEKIVQDTSVDLNKLTIEELEGISNVVLETKTIVTITEADAKISRIPRTQLAEEYLKKIKDALETYKKERSAKYLIRAIIYTVIATFILVLIQFILSKIFPRIYRLIDSWRETRMPSFTIQNMELVTASRLTDVCISVVRLIRWIIVLLVLYIYFPLVFSFSLGQKN